MLRKINEEITNLEHKIDLSKKFPDYFKRKWIFHIAFLLILCLVVADYKLNDDSFISFSFYCDTKLGTPCLNPLYDCANYRTFNYKNELCMHYDDEKVRNKICVNDICNKRYVENGTRIGRTDFLSQYSQIIIILIILIAFIINHLFYLRSKK